jgi:hypothetical protein
MFYSGLTKEVNHNNFDYYKFAEDCILANRAGDLSNIIS